MIKIQKWLVRFFSWIEKNEPILIILGLVVLLRLPTLYEINRYADEDIYLTVGQGLRRGLVLYRDIYDNKTPLIYFVAMAAGSVARFRLVLLLWHLMSVVVLWKLAEKLLNKNWAVVLATLLFGVFTTLPLLEGLIANGEMFMILPTTIAIFLVMADKGKLTERRGRYLWSGVFWSAAFLFKSPPIIEFGGLLFFYSFYLAESGSDFWKRLASVKLWLFLIGFLMPILLVFVYFLTAGAGQAFIESAFLQTIPYLSAWGGGSIDLLSGGLWTRVMILFFSLALIWCWRRRLDRSFGFLLIWFVTALFGATLSGRPYPHYLIEIVGPAALLIGYGLSQFSVLVFGLSLYWLVLLSGTIVWYKFWYYTSLPYYQNFVEYVFGRRTKEQYYGFWGNNVLDNTAAAKYIRRATGKDDRIFVWGTEPAIYALSERLPAVKYTVAYHIRDFDAFDWVVEELTRERPRMIVVVKNEIDDFTQLTGLIDADYVLTEELASLKIYLRLNKN